LIGFFPQLIGDSDLECFHCLVIAGLIILNHNALLTQFRQGNGSRKIRA
jgi:hypothetical protein